MKMFNKILMTSEFDVSKLKAGVFYDSNDAQADVEDGAFVSVLGLEDHDIYTGMKDFNARKITAYDDAAPIYGFIDYVGVAHGKILGNEFRVGDKLVGTAPSAGEVVRVRIPELGDEFYLGDDNFASAPTVGQFAAPTAGSTAMTPAAAAPASGFGIEIEDERTLITGQVNEGSKLYRCRVISL